MAGRGRCVPVPRSACPLRRGGAVGVQGARLASCFPNPAFDLPPTSLRPLSSVARFLVPREGEGVPGRGEPGRSRERWPGFPVAALEDLL